MSVLKYYDGTEWKEVVSSVAPLSNPILAVNNISSQSTSGSSYLNGSNITVVAPEGANYLELCVQIEFRLDGTGSERQAVVEVRDALNGNGGEIVRTVLTTALSYDICSIQYPIPVTPGQTYDFSITYRVSSYTTELHVLSSNNVFYVRAG